MYTYAGLAVFINMKCACVYVASTWHNHGDFISVLQAVGVVDTLSQYLYWYYYSQCAYTAYAKSTVTLSISSPCIYLCCHCYSQSAVSVVSHVIMYIGQLYSACRILSHGNLKWSSVKLAKAGPISLK